MFDYTERKVIAAAERITNHIDNHDARIAALEARMDKMENYIRIDQEMNQQRYKADAANPLIQPQDPRETEAPKVRQGYLKVRYPYPGEDVPAKTLPTHSGQGTVIYGGYAIAVNPADLVESPPDKTWAREFYAASASAAKWKGLVNDLLVATEYLNSEDFSVLRSKVRAALDEDKA